MRKAKAAPKEKTKGIPKFKTQAYNGGRPFKTLDELPEGWQKTIIDEMSAGASKQEIKALLGVSNDVHTRWMKTPDAGAEDKFGEYRDHIKQGDVLCHAWWEKAGRTHLKDPYFSPVLWYMNMKNRFGWRDKADVEISDPGRDAAVKKIISFGGAKIELT